MIDINEWIALSLRERQKHLDLHSDCVEIGGTSQEFRGTLSYFLGTTIPKGHKVFLCHACHNCKCSNPKHLYWGTPAENVKDAIDFGTYRFPYESTLLKYGEEKCKEIYSKLGRTGGGRNKGKSKSAEHRKKISITLQKNQKAL